MYMIQAVQIIGEFFPERRYVPLIAKQLKPSLISAIMQPACETLARIGDPAAIPALLEVLPRKGVVFYDTVAARSVPRALEALTGQSFGDDRGRWEAWWQTTGKKQFEKAKKETP